MSDRPQFVIELPDGDTRIAKVWFVEKRADGKWYISVVIEGNEPPNKAGMDKAECLRILKLLSSLEGWSFGADRGRMPDHMLEELNICVDMLANEVTK